MHGARYGPCEAAALQERMKRAVALLGKAEVEAILEKEGRIEARLPAFPGMLMLKVGNY